MSQSYIRELHRKIHHKCYVTKCDKTIVILNKPLWQSHSPITPFHHVINWNCSELSFVVLSRSCLVMVTWWLSPINGRLRLVRKWKKFHCKATWMNLDWLHRRSHIHVSVFFFFSHPPPPNQAEMTSIGCFRWLYDFITKMYMNIWN